MKAKLILAAIVAMGIGTQCLAATITVTTTDTSISQDGQCSLVEAIDNANDDVQTHADCAAGSGADVIELASSATYELDEVRVMNAGPNGLPTILSAISINGNGSTIRRAAGAPEFRFFVVNVTGDLTLNDVTLENGTAGTSVGGALYNNGGIVMLTGSTVTGNSASGAGGIYNDSGTVTLTGSEVSFNTGIAGIGGLSSAASTGDAIVVIERSLIHGNQAIGSGAGGIYSVGDATHRAELHISESEITDNFAEYDGGGVSTRDSVVLIEDSAISGNETYSATAYSYCAGVGIGGGAGEIRRSTISGNYTQSLADLSGFGGGVCINDSTTIISNSTISGNEARGAATTGSMSGRGGGLMVVGGAPGAPSTVDTLVIVEDSTICDNMAETFGGGVAVNRFAGTMAVTVELRNTVVAENFEGGGAVLGNCVEEAPAIITSADYNLADDTTCQLIAGNDLVVADAQLSDLADHGGPTWTHVPDDGSPVIDSGDDATCPATDQRGAPRPLDGDGDGGAHCDRGAAEAGVLLMDGFEIGDATRWSATVP